MSEFPPTLSDEIKVGGGGGGEDVTIRGVFSFRRGGG